MTKFIRRRTALAVGIAAGALAAPMVAHHSQAQNIYPSGKTVRIVVPFAAGGGTFSPRFAADSWKQRSSSTRGLRPLIGTTGIVVICDGSAASIGQAS
jgi:hypothetical protein